MSYSLKCNSEKNYQRLGVMKNKLNLLSFFQHFLVTFLLAVSKETAIGSKNRKFFVIKSISKKSGEYQVKFKSDCGDKTSLQVRVR
jgi:hypothetical protein